MGYIVTVSEEVVRERANPDLTIRRLVTKVPRSKGVLIYPYYGFSVDGLTGNFLIMQKGRSLVLAEGSVITRSGSASYVNVTEVLMRTSPVDTITPTYEAWPWYALFDHDGTRHVLKVGEQGFTLDGRTGSGLLFDKGNRVSLLQGSVAPASRYFLGKVVLILTRLNSFLGEMTL
jgi:lipid-binding SYLF domain-containing protein